MNEITIKDIAEAAGVSYATVSRTLNDRKGVSPKAKERVLEAVSKLGYKPNIQARSLKTNQTSTIALIIPDISNPFFSDIALTVNRTASRRGYNTILCNTDWNSEIEASQLRMVQEQRVDGIILKPADQITPPFLECGIPLVFISNLASDKFSYIEVDNRKGGREAADHLIQCGYRRMAFVGGSDKSRSNRDRLDGFQEELQKKGIQFNPDYIKFGPFTIDSGSKLMNELLSLPKPPDAVFCGNDLIAMGVMKTLGEKEIQVPEDFGVIGFDDVYYSSLPQIQMTTIAQPREKMGSLAADKLIDLIETPNIKSVSHVVLEPELVIRKSTRSIQQKVIKNHLVSEN